jgi:hypothetical protein
VITGIGLLILPICLFYAGRQTALLALVFICSTFMAAAVLVIGGYGISPGLLPTGMFMAIFVMQTIFGTRYPAERRVMIVLLPFIIVVAWALSSSILMPRLFENDILVWPQKLSGFAVITPLAPNAGNMTQDLYLSAAAALTVSAAIYLTQTGIRLRRLFDAYLVAGCLMVFIALWQFASNIAGLWFPSTFFLSNPGWAILTEESIGSFIRITGPCSEPAELACYLCGTIGACGWIVLNGHKDILPKLLLAGATLMLLLCTSTTGYAGLLGMAALLALYTLFLGSAQLRKRVVIMFAAIFALVAAAVVTIPVAAPGVAHTASVIFESTITKQQSSSFNDRTSADRDSVHEMEESYGLGVGWGSNRSSSLIPGLLAAIGIVGVMGLAWFVINVTSHVRAANRLNPPDDLRLVMRGCIGGLIGTLVASVISAPTITSPDFYLLIALLVATAARIRHQASIGVVPQAAAAAEQARAGARAALARSGYQAWRV